MTMPSELNRRVKRWPGWVVLGLVAVALMAIGVSRDSGPQNQRERIDVISKRIACPTCDGESVFESRASSSDNVRREIARLVAESQLTDDEIVRQIDDFYVENLTLTPDATGLEGLAWILPVVVAVLSVGGLAFAFRQWRDVNALKATEDDRVLVAAALDDQAARVSGAHADADGGVATAAVEPAPDGAEGGTS
jgi:cytochrome c-type biogenesis protein CcmH